jgi:hypothetical protein
MDRPPRLAPLIALVQCTIDDYARISRKQATRTTHSLTKIPCPNFFRDNTTFSSRIMRITALAALCFSSSTASALSPAFVVQRRGISSTSLRMTTKLSQDELKKMVGYKAVDDYVKSGMVIGLGTGSTAYYAVERVGEKLKSGELKDILAIPTSIRTKEQAESLGIPLVTLDTHSKLDVAIDGADEVDPDLNLVKGGGGALLREKMVEICADKFIVIGTYILIIGLALICCVYAWNARKYGKERAD